LGRGLSLDARVVKFRGVRFGGTGFGHRVEAKLQAPASVRSLEPLCSPVGARVGYGTEDDDRVERRGSVSPLSFAPAGVVPFPSLRPPTACAVGCILWPLRGWGSFLRPLFRR